MALASHGWTLLTCTSLKPPKNSCELLTCCEGKLPAAWACSLQGCVRSAAFHWMMCDALQSLNKDNFAGSLCGLLFVAQCGMSARVEHTVLRQQPHRRRLTPTGLDSP